MNRLLLSLMLAIIPVSSTLAAANDACQTLVNLSPQSVLNCYENQTNAALQGAKNKFIGNFIAGLSGSGAMPNAKDGTSSLSNQSTGQKTEANQEQTQTNNQAVKYY